MYFSASSSSGSSSSSSSRKDDSDFLTAAVISSSYYVACQLSVLYFGVPILWWILGFYCSTGLRITTCRSVLLDNLNNWSAIQYIPHIY
jgi:hypothetical protein